MNLEQKQVLALVQTGELRRLYANTYYSLVDRLDEAGYLEESYVPGRYPGNFSRSTGAYVFLMIQTGRLDLAHRALRCVLDTMQRHALRRAPHVFGKPRRLPDGSIRQELDMVDQIDGTAHILSAYGELVLRDGGEALYEEYWPLMSQVMDIHSGQPYFFGDPNCRFPVRQLNLYLNTAFEHSRLERYWCCFDLLTQSFMGAALEKMAAVARRYRQIPQATRWEAQLAALRGGIARNLTVTEGGKTRYAEMRLPDSNAGELFPGVGWVCLSPVAAGWAALPQPVLDNTVSAVRRALWLPDPGGEGLFYLDKDSGDTPCRETIGKGLGWDMEAARQAGQWGHIAQLLAFLRQRHQAELYGECMFYRDGQWHSRDNGNAEQCIWWCWAMAKLRESLGLAKEPERAAVTTRPICTAAGSIQTAAGG